MARGGARNRSGPSADPQSARSEARGLSFKLLPREGFTGRVPAFPLVAPTTRERAVWRELWRTPQAAMWNVERWRMPAIGLYCRLFVRSEAADANASLIGQLHRLADQLGLTPAGLKENGWRMAVDELAAARAQAAPDRSAAIDRETPETSPRRLRGVASA